MTIDDRLWVSRLEFSTKVRRLERAAEAMVKAIYEEPGYPFTPDDDVVSELEKAWKDLAIS